MMGINHFCENCNNKSMHVGGWVLSITGERYYRTRTCDCGTIFDEWAIRLDNKKEELMDRDDFKSLKQNIYDGNGWMKSLKEIYGDTSWPIRLEDDQKACIAAVKAFAGAAQGEPFTDEVIISKDEYDDMKKRVREAEIERDMAERYRREEREDAKAEYMEMEIDIGKLRTYLGSERFDAIVDGKDPEKVPPRSPARDWLGNWRGGVK